MSYLIIQLGGRIAKAFRSHSNTVCFSLSKSHAESPMHLEWPSDCSGQLLNKLIDEARFAIWSVEAAKIISGHETSLKSLSLSEIDLQKFASMEINGDFEEGLEQILLNLKDIALKILKRQTIFVFSSEWNLEFSNNANKYLKLIAFEVCTFFKEVSVERNLPWAFIVDGQRHQSDPLKILVKNIHGLMLQEKDSANRLNRWKQKQGTVLLAGPTGSGKSYAARLLASEHYSTFVEVNLAAINENTLESRMRGYVEGSFTDAKKGGRKGWFEEANGGVLFLDEFQSTPVSFQTQLLDVLNAVSDEISIAQVGDDGNRKSFRVKVVIAVNEDIELLLSQKRMRKDIFFRVRHIELFPSLADRLQHDTDNRYLRGLLATYRWNSLNVGERFTSEPLNFDMLSKFFPVFSSDALFEIKNKDWEGNFRELERVAFDIFYECDFLNGSSEITSRRVIDIINSWYDGDKAIYNQNPKDPVVSSAEFGKLKEIQSAILKCEFIIKDVINGQHQSYYRSRLPLRNYLIKNKHLLDSNILSDSRMRKFLRE